MTVTINGTTGLTTNNSVYTDASGNTGIGTTSPLSQSKLTVAGSSLSVTGSDGNFAAGGQRSFIDFAGGKARIGGTGGGGTGTSLGLYVGTGAEALVVNSSGDFNSAYGGGNLNQGPMYVCRAWVSFDGGAASPITPRGSANVSSVTKSGTANCTINLTSAMPDANYAVIGSGGAGSTTTSAILISCNPINTSSFFINTRNGVNSDVAYPYTQVAIFR